MPAAPRANRTCLALVWVALQMLPLASAAAANATVERWFELRIGAVPAGYIHELLDARDADAVRTTTESVIVINRLETRVEIAEQSVAVEDRDGRLLSVHSEMRTSKDPTVLDLSVADDQLMIVTQAGGRRYERVAHETRPLLGPEGIRALSAARLAAGADTVSYATFVPELGGASGVTRRVTARQAGDGSGARFAVEETLEALPAVSRLLLDADGRIVEESVDGPFGEMLTVPATAAVRERVLAAGPLPEELYARALVRSNVRLPEPRSIDRLRVRIDLKRPGTGFPQLEGPYQHVVERSSEYVVLEIRRAPAIEGAPVAGGAAAADTQPNYILQSDDPEVRALARTLRIPGAGPYAQARALQDWVAEHMRFDAGLAMLPASEVVRDRGGTCVAYSVLLTSLARALGIPARIVMGYVYVGNVWGGHAWSEIRVRGRWIPLDAAVYRPGPADAAHIAVVRHAGELGAASGAAELGRLFGNESIRVLGYRTGGVWVDVPAGAPPYRIDGDRYRNDWLGIRLDKPAGYAFAKADATYPDSTVIALAATDGGEIRLRQSGPRAASTDPRAWLRAEGYEVEPATTTVAGRIAWRGTRAAQRALAFRAGLDLWLLDAAGADALRDLDTVAAHLVLRPATH
jgi:transglutaminase-like putative cysteine protease